MVSPDMAFWLAFLITLIVVLRALAAPVPEDWL